MIRNAGVAFIALIIFFVSSCSTPILLSTSEAAGRAVVSTVVYYVDSVSGSDANNGTSTATPWKTLEKANSVTLLPGEKLLFKAGGVWDGQLAPKGSGSSAGQIIISSYGTGAKPLINGGGTAPTNDGTYNYATGAVQITNQEYITIDGLALTNVATPNVAIRDGIRVALSDPVILHHIQILNNEIYNINGQASRDSGVYNDMYANGAIHIWAQGTMNSGYHFDDVLIKGNSIHDVDTSGIRIHNRDDYPVVAPFNTNVLIDSNIINNTGSDGIIVANCNSPVVQYNQILNSGSRSIPATHIIAGAWVCSSVGGLFQYNEVANTRLIDSDGTAFDTDWGVSGTVIYQYNYTHGNEGGIWLDCAGLVSQSGYDKTIYRYNVSVDEGVSLLRTSGAKLAEFYNNVFYKSSGSYTMDFGYSGELHKFWNNIFAFPTEPDWQSVTYVHNIYYPCTAAPGDGAPITDNPLLVSPGSSANGMATADNYKVTAASSAINRGISIPGNGTTDFWGTALYSGLADLGAQEYPGGTGGGYDDIVSGNSYKLIDLGSGKVLGVSGMSTANGASVIQWADNGTADHKWRVILNANGTYRLVNVNSGKAIGVLGMSTVDGASIVQWDDNGSADHNWTFQPQGGNAYKLINANSGKALGISAGGIADGTAAIQWTSGQAADQVFVLVPAP